MSNLQRILLGIVLVTVIVLIILTWGSAASIMFIYLLLMAIPAFLLNHFMDKAEDSEFNDRND